ncbi:MULTISPECIES: septal ring lytic transglycosylase RlpA family protein [Bradyrhizobium]|uniref:septal ring lytic transglycosylase RlpA family protein n=1 Tax=Bradyrhizobium TaxID=374 RepID=UPI0009FCDA7F|nr:MULTISPECIES: septal ring lytic transglycosylase RlpA family protein [Bradyrhizobium]UFW45410.1 septal ring lytic transglycosylase RlpA family protein [Bradyrhizobium arachidis]
MHPVVRMVAIATVPVWIGLTPESAAAQDFNDRWSIIPKAHADPAPEGLEQVKKDEPQAQPPTGQDTLKDARTSNRVFSGKASFYAYSKSKTASGSLFNRNLLTAAHRNLPFGTKVRVTHGGSSVIVTINDRGPFVRGRVLDLSRAAAQSLGITELGVAHIRAEVL